MQHLLSYTNFDFSGLSESWLHTNSPSSELHVPGYNIFRRDRSKGRGGGVMIYIKDHINCHQICWPFDHELESTGLNIVLSSAMSLCSLLCIVHIPLIMIFVSHLKSYLKHVILKTEVILLGDLNCNWLDTTNRKPLKQITDYWITGFYTIVGRSN